MELKELNKCAQVHLFFSLIPPLGEDNEQQTVPKPTQDYKLGQKSFGPPDAIVNISYIHGNFYNHTRHKCLVQMYIRVKFDVILVAIGKFSDV